MSTNVILNLADTSGADIVNASAQLRLRSTSLTVHAYDLFDFLVNPFAVTLGITGSNPRATRTIAEIQRQCDSAGKLILSSHGPLDATNYSVIKDPLNLIPGAQAGAVPNVAGRSVRISLQQMAAMFGRFLKPHRKYYIATLICYAARTGNYAANHATAGDLQWSDSFACQLFALLCENRTAKLTMSARTGQHGFSRTTGLSEVQSEAAVAAEIEAIAQDYGALDAWLEDTKLTAFGVRHAARDANTLAFALAYYQREATLMAAQRSAFLRTHLQTRGNTMPAPDRQQFQALLARIERDTNRLQVVEHYGKIYYHFDPARQRIKIKRDNRNRIGWHSQEELQEVALATVLGHIA